MDSKELVRTDGSRTNRRTFLKLSGTGALASVDSAGCVDTENGDEGNGNGGDTDDTDGDDGDGDGHGLISEATTM